MKFPLFNKKTSAARLAILIACILTLSSFSAAQGLSSRRTEQKSAAEQKSDEIVMAPLATALFQCANGGRGSTELSCADGNWQFGNLNRNNSQWVEGEFVPYRALITNLTVGSSYTITISYGTTKNGKHAIDYLGTWDQSTLAPNGPGGADACVNVDPCSAPTTAPIPLDPTLTAANPGIQPAGNFTIWNGTITDVSDYTTTGTYATTSDTSITLTYTANAEDVVIAFGGHISSRVDWSLTGTAISISGSPYHASVGGGDRSMDVDAAILPAYIIIIKEVTTLTLDTTATFAFNFTYTPAGGVAIPFSLVDETVGTGGGGPTINDLDEGTTEIFQVQNFTAIAPSIASTVTEALQAPWSLLGITCIEQSGGLPNLPNTTTNFPGGRSANIIAEEAEVITCTFANTQLAPTAAPATISGRAVDSFGRGISGARLTVMNAQTGEMSGAVTNSFGYYTVVGPEVGNFYVMTISHRRYTFADDTRSFSLHDSISGVDFVANP